MTDTPKNLRFTCPGCQARLTVHPTQTESRQKCPKCERMLKIPATAAPIRPPVARLADDELSLEWDTPRAPPADDRLDDHLDDGGQMPHGLPSDSPPRLEDSDEFFQLSEPVDLSQYQNLTQQHFSPATFEPPAQTEPIAPWSSATRPVQPAATPVPPGARSVQAGHSSRAPAEPESESRKAVPHPQELPPVFSFLAQPAAIARTIGLSLVLAFIGMLLAAANYLQDQGLLAIGSVFAMGLATAVAGFTIVCLCASCLAVLQDTANGEKKVQDWPGVAFWDWLPQALFVVNALMIGALPGMAVAHLLLGGAGSVGGVASGLLSIHVLFPVVLLSMLEQNSPLMPVSFPIWRSMRAFRKAWTTFYIASAGVLVPLAFSGWFAWHGVFAGEYFRILIAAVIAVPLALIYFRLLGRLAWICSQEESPA